VLHQGSLPGRTRVILVTGALVVALASWAGCGEASTPKEAPRESVERRAEQAGKNLEEAKQEAREAVEEARREAKELTAKERREAEQADR
jgi:hypothetical protein